MKSKKSDSEKGVGPSPNSRKPKAATAKKPERTPSSSPSKSLASGPAITCLKFVTIPNSSAFGRPPPVARRRIGTRCSKATSPRWIGRAPTIGASWRLTFPMPKSSCQSARKNPGSKALWPPSILPWPRTRAMNPRRGGQERRWPSRPSSSDAGTVTGDQDGIAPTMARSHRKDGSVAQQGAHWAPELLCRPTERPQRDLVLRPGSRPVAADASAPQPTVIYELGEDAPSRRSILPADQDPTSDALSPLRRQNPREEPGALAAHAGICAGGAGRPASLPRPSRQAS